MQRLVAGSRKCEIHMHYLGCYCFVLAFLSYFWFLLQVCLVFMCAHCNWCARFSLINQTMISGEFQVTQEGRQWKQNQKILLFFCSCSCAPSSLNQCHIFCQSLYISVDGRTRQTRKKKMSSLTQPLSQQGWATLPRPSLLSLSGTNSDPRVRSFSSFSSLLSFILPWIPHTLQLPLPRPPHLDLAPFSQALILFSHQPTPPLSLGFLLQTELWSAKLLFAFAENRRQVEKTYISLSLLTAWASLCMCVCDSWQASRCFSNVISTRQCYTIWV